MPHRSARDRPAEIQQSKKATSPTTDTNVTRYCVEEASVGPSAMPAGDIGAAQTPLWILVDPEPISSTARDLTCQLAPLPIAGARTPKGMPRDRPTTCDTPEHESLRARMAPGADSAKTSVFRGSDGQLEVGVVETIPSFSIRGRSRRNDSALAGQTKESSASPRTIVTWPCSSS